MDNLGGKIGEMSLFVMTLDSKNYPCKIKMGKIQGYGYKFIKDQAANVPILSVSK